MYEKLLGALLTHPGALIAAGRGLFALGGLMALLGFRFSRLGTRVTRVFERHGVEPPDLTSGLPWWLRLLIPETTSGWIFVVIVLTTGICLVQVGKWARKFRA
ncbi:MAG: hypothetical protein A3J24_09385 [Deltaproteobacteria bacterium RIFCSPLOWO2_02_FULL_53_8]|nr:MAG: hypothetical protein A3J24_09385 [Deltaproteobacteria bacterium RIFCSPLOWO2_02_FULL_53_8]